MIDSFKTDRMFELIEQHKVTFVFAVPSMLLLMAQSPERQQHDLRSVVCVAFGAAPMPVHKLQSVQDMFPGAALVHGMGQTECSGTTATLPSQQSFEKAGSVGINIDGTDIRIVDDAGKELAANDIGELVVRGPNVMSHYLGCGIWQSSSCRSASAISMPCPRPPPARRNRANSRRCCRSNGRARARVPDRSAPAIGRRWKQTGIRRCPHAKEQPRPRRARRGVHFRSTLLTISGRNGVFSDASFSSFEVPV